MPDGIIIIERHNVKDEAGGDSGTIPLKTEREKGIQRQLALAFKEGAAYVASNCGVAKGSVYERACTECAEKRTKEVEKVIKKTK